MVIEQGLSMKQNEINDNAFASLGYLFIFPAIYALFSEKYKNNTFVRKHARHALALFVVWIFYTQAWAILTPLLAVLLPETIAYGIQNAVVAFHRILNLGFLCAWVAMTVLSYQGKSYEIPFLTKLTNRVLKLLQDKAE